MGEEKFEVQRAKFEVEASNLEPRTPNASSITRHATVLLSCLALLASFVALIQIDIPLARFFRSVHVLWIEQVGDIGDKIGSGFGLAAISVVALVMGLVFKKEMARRIGIQTAVAHGIVALLANGFKHLIGRPRPRLTHSGGFQFWPSWDSGLDSFPSGHTSASFAVATVLAKYVPQAAWAFYGMASWISASRVWRGSHFPTDVLAGVFLGVVVGMIVSRPIQAWRESLSHAVRSLVPYAVVATVLLWIACHPAPNDWINAVCMAAGVSGIVAGVGSRLLTQSRARWPWLLSRPLADVLIVMGLSLTTGSIVAIGLVGLATLATWFGRSQTAESNGLDGRARTDVVSSVTEGLYAAAVVLAVLIIQGLKGIVPMQ